MIREIHVEKVITAVKELCIESNCIISPDIEKALHQSIPREQSEVGREVIGQIIKNAELANIKQMPICQDTGMAVVWIEIGQEVHIVGGSLEEAIHEGVRQGYKEGYLRNSVVGDPFERKNTNDNTPAIIHYEMTLGENLCITVAPKGFGSENMSRIYMLKPSDGLEGAKKSIIQTVDEAGSNACPPMIVGVGIGGNFEKAAILAKKALLRPVGIYSPKPHISAVEKELMQSINNLGIGPQGFGGNITVLGVHIETYPTHIAGLPVAINISCHVTRHASKIL